MVKYVTFNHCNMSSNLIALTTRNPVMVKINNKRPVMAKINNKQF